MKCRASGWVTFWVAIVLPCLSCTQTLFELNDADSKRVNQAVVSHFVRSVGSNDWAVIYVSDEFLTEAVDSAWIESLSSSDVLVRRGRRNNVSEPDGTIPDGVLLVEPSDPHSRDGVRADESLAFSSAGEFTGALGYSLKRSLHGDWVVAAVNLLWIA